MSDTSKTRYHESDAPGRVTNIPCTRIIPSSTIFIILTPKCFLYPSSIPYPFRRLLRRLLLYLHLLMHLFYIFFHPQIHRPPIDPTSSPHRPY